jgi:hypothetical protein
MKRHGASFSITNTGSVALTPASGQGFVLNGVTRNSVAVSLTAAQIIAMGTTPVQLIAAPASGKCVIVDNITFKMTTTATAFTGGGAVEFRYTNASGTKVTADVAAAVVTAGAGVSFTNVRGIEASTTGTVDAAIVIRNATAAFAAGTGSAVVSIDYHVV